MIKTLSFNDLSTRLGLFHAEGLGNHIHIYTFYVVVSLNFCAKVIY